MCKGKYSTHWKEVELMKDPLDLVVVQTLLHDLKPQPIIEFGTYRGGRAHWMADLCQAYQLNGSKVFTVDIDLTLVDPRVRSNPQVHLRQGDANNPHTIFPPEELQVHPSPGA